MVFDEVWPAIDIQVENGIYYMGTKSATGKTYLMNLAQQIFSAEGKATGISCAGSMDVEEVKRAVFSDLKLVVLDRFDMANDEIKQFVKSLYNPGNYKTPRDERLCVRDKVILVNTYYPSKLAVPFAMVTLERDRIIVG